MPLTSEPQPALTLPASITQLYFRMIVPLICVLALWATWINPPHDYLLMLPFCVPLLLVGTFYHAVPARLEWGVRLAMALLHIGFLWVLAVFGAALGVKPNLQAIDIVLLVGPVTALSWPFVFFDHPRTGAVLTVLLSVASAALIASWGIQAQDGGGWIWPVLLVTSLLAAWFGWQVNQLQRRAMHMELGSRLDVLTGLHNRRAFEQVRLPSGSAGFLAVLDIDHFKAVNDSQGHPAGDRMLRAVGGVLLDQLPPGAQAFRWGGEEFVLLLPGYDLPQSLAVLEAVRLEIAARTFAGGRQLTLSGGLSAYGPVPTLPLPTAFEQADHALLEAKRAGRNRVAVWGAGGEYASQ